MSFLRHRTPQRAARARSCARSDLHLARVRRADAGVLASRAASLNDRSPKLMTLDPAAPPKDAWRRILRNVLSILLGDAAGEIFARYAILLAATSLGPARVGQMSEAPAF